METDNSLKEFVDQVLGVERLLDKRGVPGSVGRVLYVLRTANQSHGVTQQEIVSALGLRKDRVSKLLGPLETAGLLTRDRDRENPKVKRLALSRDGKDLLSKIMAVLETPRPKRVSVAQPGRKPLSFDFD